MNIYILNKSLNYHRRINTDNRIFLILTIKFYVNVSVFSHQKNATVLITLYESYNLNHLMRNFYYKTRWSDPEIYLNKRVIEFFFN